MANNDFKNKLKSSETVVMFISWPQTVIFQDHSAFVFGLPWSSIRLRRLPPETELLFREELTLMPR